jgi:hypothetical protein
MNMRYWAVPLAGLGTFVAVFTFGVLRLLLNSTGEEEEYDYATICEL